MAVFISRRALLAGASAGAVMVSMGKLRAETALPPVTVSKDPNCGCCGAWVDHAGETPDGSGWRCYGGYGGEACGDEETPSASAQDEYQPGGFGGN